MKSHLFLGTIDWGKLEDRLIPAPFKPTIKGELDDSNFHSHFEDEAQKFYPKCNFPKQMFIEFAETWVGAPPANKKGGGGE